MQISDILSPWEFDANAPPRVLSVAQGQDMKMAVIQEDKCCRIVYRMDGDDGNWMLTSYSVGGLRLPDNFPKAFSLSPQHLREYVQRHRANYQICRSMFLRASGFSGRVFCDAQGWSHYHEQNDEQGDLNTVFYLGGCPSSHLR